MQQPARPIIERRRAQARAKPAEPLLPVGLGIP